MLERKPPRMRSSFERIAQLTQTPDIYAFRETVHHWLSAGASMLPTGNYEEKRLLGPFFEQIQMHLKWRVQRF
jgi:hypothetical protein